MSAIVPQSFPGETIVCLASGPSLTPADVDYCCGRARVIAIKDTIRLAPWADVLYACDARWWKHYGPTLAYDGPKYALEAAAEPWAQVLRVTGYTGLETDPSGLRTGKNSGFQAINLAAHLGARRIVLLGYDMVAAVNGAVHWFGAHPWPTRSWPELASHFLPLFASLVEPLQALGIQILNATRRTDLDCFDRVSLEEALA